MNTDSNGNPDYNTSPVQNGVPETTYPNSQPPQDANSQPPQDAPVNTSVAEPSTAPALQNDAPGTVETPPTQPAQPPQDAPDAQQQQDVVTFVKMSDADIAAIVSAITPVIYAQFERILPALQAQGAQTIHDVQTGVGGVIEQQHMSLLSRIEGLLHPAQ